MTQVILNVKGSPDVARMAAERRGFSVRSARECPSSRSTTLVAEGSLAVACYWFCEAGDVTPGEGFPAGTLLLYR